MTICAYVVWFWLASVAGWLFESTFAILSTGAWDRRGFLFGPVCPIYGIGVVTALLLFDRLGVASGEFPAWGVFLVSMVGSAVLEYLVSAGLERLFGAVWWDYSDLPFNLNGRICLPASLLFGATGVFVAYVLAPTLNAIASQVVPAAFEVAALALVALLACDTTATVINLSNLMERIVELDVSVNDRATSLTDQTVSVARAVPSLMGSGARKAVGKVRRGGAGAMSVLGSAKAAATQKMGEASAVQQAMITRTAETLTEHQARMLAQLRRFRSDELRRKAEALRNKIRELSEGSSSGDKDSRNDG